jgi:hypothetical protein
MADLTVWSAWSEKLAPTTLTKGATTSRTVFDLSGMIAGRVNIRLSMIGTTVPATGIDIFVKPLCGADGAVDIQGIGTYFVTRYLPSGTIASTVIAGTVADGVSTLIVTAMTNFAVGDLIAIFDATYTRLEFNQVMNASATPTPDEIYVASPVCYEHTAAQADVVIDNAGGWSVVLDGGCVYEIVVSYADDATGSDAVLQIMSQTLDYA